MKYGKPNMDFTKWRWKPDDCELPLFNPAQFLELVRGKSLAFVGDSIARNQMQSLICLLSKIDDPVDVSYSTNAQFKRFFYTNYNFTIAILWSPYLVKTKETGPNNPGIFDLYLDEFDDEWTSQIDKFDYLIMSAGQWFFRPSMFYENGQLIGCLYCKDDINVTHFGLTYGYRRAFETAFRAINSLGKFKGIAFLRTFTPSHFENGLWNKGGNCDRTSPFMSNETSLNGENLEMYMTQLEEFRVAEKEGMKKGLRFRLLDTSQAMWLRPDGHPSRYWHGPEETSKYNDCVHWCLPGPIDAWNDFLLEILKREG
ncbi:PC-Esterase [Macleaya cordata]|uniref:PC-Esterase n=1 Tax=Macleaya cordata TaxID=56857 RepID=A0A200Q7I3_MACCD|nr:PC-Esterase [Macleaya cordata]